LDQDAVWDGQWVGRGMGVLDGIHVPQREEGWRRTLPKWFWGWL